MKNYVIHKNFGTAFKSTNQSKIVMGEGNGMLQYNKRYLYLYLSPITLFPLFFTVVTHFICLSYYIKWVTTSQTHSNMKKKDVQTIYLSHLSHFFPFFSLICVQEAVAHLYSLSYYIKYGNYFLDT